MLGYEGKVSDVEWGEAVTDITSGQALERPQPLFRKLILEEVEEKPEPEKEVFSIEALDLRIGLIESCEDHPDAEKLYVMKVNFGAEERQLVAGLKAYYTKEEMLGRKIVVVMNLKPAKLRGVESRGMLLAAEDKSGVVSLLAPYSDEDLGIAVTARGCDTGKAKKQVSFSEFQKLELRVGTVTQEEKADLGKDTQGIQDGISTALAGTQLAFYLVSGKDEVAPMETENGGLITIHRPVENGAQIK
jgi:methionyl-tRNA synthetase